MCAFPAYKKAVRIRWRTLAWFSSAACALALTMSISSMLSESNPWSFPGYFGFWAIVTVLGIVLFKESYESEQNRFGGKFFDYVSKQARKRFRNLSEEEAGRQAQSYEVALVFLIFASVINLGYECLSYISLVVVSGVAGILGGFDAAEELSASSKDTRGSSDSGLSEGQCACSNDSAESPGGSMLFANIFTVVSLVGLVVISIIVASAEEQLAELGQVDRSIYDVFITYFGSFAFGLIVRFAGHFIYERERKKT